jgi:diadenosine tetraphosphate (Ap4A) HIT family hydrolase
MLKTVGIVAEKLKLENNFRLQLNNGSLAGQIVEHLHLHFLSRGATENLVFEERK